MKTSINVIIKNGVIEILDPGGSEVALAYEPKFDCLHDIEIAPYLLKTTITAGGRDADYIER